MEHQLASGPYRATVLWNSLVRTFRSDIPLSRHRRYMKTYEECFVASDAITWLHQYLQKNPNFDTDVTKAQTIQLLQKLYKARVFEDVRGSKHDHGEFTDSGRLYRLTSGSPLKSIRTPLALKCNLKLANQQLASTSVSPRPPRKLDFTKAGSLLSLPDTRSSTLPECHFVTRPLTADEIEQEWKTVTLLSLQKVLGVDSLENVIDQQLVSGRNIMHNCLYVNKSGVVTNIDPQDQLPHWALSAMKCLAYWPDKIDSTLPNYVGFEKDVFRVVKEYFCGLSDPLMTHVMYEVITNVFVEADRGRLCKHLYPANNRAWPNTVCSNTTTFKSVENLLMKLTHSNTPASECQDVCEEDMLLPGVLDLSPIRPVGHDTSATVYTGPRRDQNTPVTRYETAFGPDNRTVTRVFFGDGISTDFKHDDDEDSQSQHTPVETHFDGSLDGVNEPGFNRNNASRHSARSWFCRKEQDKNSSRAKMRRRRTTNMKSSDSLSYGCSVGVYSRPNSDAAVQRATCTRPISDINTAIPKGPVTGRPPVPSEPPSYHSLFPESLSPHSHKPVMDGARKIKRKKSLSSSILHKRRSFLGSYSSSREDMPVSSTTTTGQAFGCDTRTVGSHDAAAAGDTNVVGSRSRSMSDLATAVHLENQLQEQCQTKSPHGSDDSVFVDESTDRIIQALQLVCLLIPPANRRRLHLLLRLMNKISTNEKLVLSDVQSSRNLLLETFYRVVLTSAEEADMDDILVVQLVAFLMDHYVQIMSVPPEVKVTVEQRLATLQRTKVRHVSADGSLNLRYCEHVSMDEYENQRLSGSQQALTELLEGIITDTSRPPKEKRKRLKQFKQTYPDIYRRRFPSESDLELSSRRPKIKPPLLAKPLLKLKGLRL